VVSQLNQQQGAEVEDITTSPPEQEPYDRFKAELVRRLSTSREQRVRQLLSHEEKGERKPLQFLWHVKSLDPDVPEDFFKPSGPAGSHRTCTAFLLARLKAVSTEPPTSRT
jgi:hypothetical protein